MLRSRSAQTRAISRLTDAYLHRYASSLSLATTTIALAIHSGNLALRPDADAVPLNLLLQVALMFVFWWWCSIRSASLLAAPFVFLFTIFFWHSGFLSGRAFHVNAIFEFPGSVLTYGEEYVPAAVALISLCMGLAVVGAVIGFVQVRMQRASKVPEARASGVLEPAVRSCAWILFGGCSLLACVFYIVEGQGATSYLELYSAASSGSILYRLYHMTKFLGVAAIAMVIAVARSRIAYRAALVAVLSLAFISALSGARTMPFLYVATLIAAIDYFRKRISLKVLLLLGFVAASVSWIMSEARASGVGLHVFSLSAAGDRVHLWHLVWNSGGSVRAVLRTMAFSAMSAPLYGATFLHAITYVVPSPIVSAVAPWFRPQPPSEWMLEQSLDVPRGEPVGMGYSLVAEVFLNFRFVGALVFLFLGWVIAVQYFKFRLRDDVFAGLQALNLVVLLALHLRNDTMTYARVVVWSAAAIWVVGVLHRRAATRARDREEIGLPDTSVGTVVET